MTRFKPHAAVNSRLELYEPQSGGLYGIDDVARFAQVPRRTILVYCKHGLVSPVAKSEWDGYYFDAEAVRALRHIEYLHDACQINLTGIRFIVALTNELKRLRTAITDVSAPPKRRGRRLSHSGQMACISKKGGNI